VRNLRENGIIVKGIRYLKILSIIFDVMNFFEKIPVFHYNMSQVVFKKGRIFSLMIFIHVIM
jgi:hypothetical protein